MRGLRTFVVFVMMLMSWAGAQSTVGVDPAARLYSAAPGQTITQVLNIYNPNPTAQRLRVVGYLSDMNISEVGETTYPPAGTLKESLSSWVTFSPSELDLGGQETKQVRYTIQVPADAAPGTHWAMMMFEAQEPNATPGKTLLSFRLRIAHTMYVNVQPSKLQGEIIGIFDNPPKTEKDFYSIGVQYANTGNQATGVQGRIEVRGASGELINSLPLPLAVALPGRTLLLRASWAGPVPKGQYTALVVLNDGDRTRDLVADHVIDLPFDLKEAAPAAEAGATVPAPPQDAPVPSTPASAAPATAPAGRP